MSTEEIRGRGHAPSTLPRDRRSITPKPVGSTLPRDRRGITPKPLSPKTRFEHLTTVWPVASPENETRSDRILKHIGAPLFSALVGTDTVMKRRPLPSAVRSAQTLCKNRFPILDPIIYVGVESPGPREEMQMIWQNNVGPDFPIGGFGPDRPQELMVFVRR